jgi:hypothetical protein
MSDPTPAKRATVAGVDKKIDDLVEIKAALEIIADVVKKSDEPTPEEESPKGNPMFG